MVQILLLTRILCVHMYCLLKISAAYVLHIGLRTGVSFPCGNSTSLARESASMYQCSREGSKKIKYINIMANPPLNNIIFTLTSGA